jgi:hypothetical protein
VQPLHNAKVVRGSRDSLIHMSRWGHEALVVTMLAVLAACVAGTASSCAGEASCRYNSDCYQAYCSNGVCKKDCVDATLDCPHGYICGITAQCEPPYDAGPDGQAPEASTRDAQGQSDSTTPHDSGHDAGHDAGRDATPPREASPGDAGQHDVMAADASGHGVEFDLCSSDGQCKSGLLCRAMYVGGAPRCTRTCAASTDCMASTACVQVGSEQYCVFQDTGRACSVASTCNFACLTAQGYCTMACASGSDCPNGYGCEAVGAPAVSVCVKAEVPCSASDTSGCIAAAACDTSATLVVAGCTLACSTPADCPQRAAGLSPWTCDGLCRRPPDVFGPVQQGAQAEYACNSSDVEVNVCNDAQHIDFAAFTIPNPPAVSCAATMTTGGSAGDSCVDSCLYGGGCAFGFMCNAVGSLGASSRIGLCLPALTGGEVGAACTADTDCVFGYCTSSTSKCSRDCTYDGVCPTGSSCQSAGSIPVEGLTFKTCQ